MTLQEYVASLSKEQQFRLALKFIKKALPIWEQYASKNSLGYIDTVVGLSHNVDKNLLKDSVQRVEYLLDTPHNQHNTTLFDLQEQFTDPIIALQDWDWELPDEVQKTFYAVYNLIEAFAGKEMSMFGEQTIYVSINQAIDAIVTAKIATFEELREML